MGLDPNHKDASAGMIKASRQPASAVSNPPNLWTQCEWLHQVFVQAISLDPSTFADACAWCCDDLDFPASSWYPMGKTD
jgi:hypothetical protein